MLLPVDMALFGQPIPTGEVGRFTKWSNISDIIKELPVIGD
jgi:hypothetical protein